jgi:hypothetical protein
MVILIAPKNQHSIFHSSLDPCILAIFRSELHLEVIWQGGSV